MKAQFREKAKLFWLQTMDIHLEKKKKGERNFRLVSPFGNSVW